MKLSFHKKQFIAVSILVFLLIIVGVSAFSLYTYNNLKKQAANNVYQLNMQTALSLQSLFEDMDKLSLYVSTNPNIMETFKDARTPGYSNDLLSGKISRIITSISVPNSSSRFRISLYNASGNFISSGIPYSNKTASEKLQAPDYTDWYHGLPIIHNQASLTGLHSDNWSDSDVTYLSLYREIFSPYFNSNATGVIDVQCPSSLLADTLAFETTDIQCYLFDEQGTIIFPQQADTKLAGRLYQTAGGNDDSGTFQTHSYAAVSLDNGWSLFMTEPQSTIWDLLFPQILTIIIISTAITIVFLIMMFLVTKRTTRPLRDLTASVKNVTLSNLSLETDTQNYPDEISSLNRAFEKMFTRLKQSMDEVVRMQAYEMQANMVALQAQMDPHFLYNILTVIKALSRENNTRQIAITCDYLAKILRYISSYEENSSLLSSEIEHTECYLKLMKIRYENQFSYSLHLDDDITADQLPIPKLTLQPLVENCFQHGFSKVSPPWEIRIYGWCEGDHWFLKVVDNGVGITDTQLAGLNLRIEQFLSNPSDSLTSLKIGGMGLVNTVARLKLKYKQYLIFEVKNREIGGTSVTLGGMMNDEHISN